MEKDGHFLAMQEPKKFHNNYLFVCTYICILYSCPFPLSSLGHVFPSLQGMFYLIKESNKHDESGSGQKSEPRSIRPLALNPDPIQAVSQHCRELIIFFIIFIITV